LGRLPKRLQWRAELDREHQLTQDLAGSRSNQRCADQYCAIAICHDLEGAPVKIVDVAARGLGRVGARSDDVDTSGPRKEHGIGGITMFFELLTPTYHIPITIDSPTQGVFLCVPRCSSTLVRARG
jgi:hypothetical protein